MNALTNAEVKALNDISMERSRPVLLGAILQSLIGQQMSTGTPVNAVKAAMELAISGVASHGETVTIGNNIYEFFAADPLYVVPTAGHIVVDIRPHVGYGTRNLTMDTQPTSGDTVTIGEKVYIFVPVGTDNADGEVSIGADLAGAQMALLQAINGADDHNQRHPLVQCGAWEANVAAITALIGGTVGNGIALSETFTAVTNIFSGVSTAGGTNCSAANASEHLIAAITASDTMGVGATAGAGNAVELEADAGGAAGNAITLAKTMANGAFTGGATHLAGGVNGTIGTPLQMMYDASYLYICVAPNTVTGLNWRRISLGTAY